MSPLDIQAKSEKSSPKEDFFNRFATEQNLLQEKILHLKSPRLPEPERTNITEECLSSISQLSNSLRDASSHLPPYDQRTYSTAIKTLTEKLQDARSAAVPKRKFAFKKSVPKLQDSSVSSASRSLGFFSLGGDNVSGGPTDSRSTPPVPNNDTKTPSTGSATTLTITNLSSTSYIIDSSTLKPVASITIISHSFIDLSISTRTAKPFSTLTIKSVTQSLLLCGEVSGAAHVTGVIDSTLIIGSRQVRMHECSNCVVYLRCSSRPIIENCHGIRFAPFPDLIDQSYGSPNNPSPNLWDQVDDFKWLKAEHSPNWSVLKPEDERAISDDGWEKIMSSEKSTSDLKDLLRAGKVMV